MTSSRAVRLTDEDGVALAKAALFSQASLVA